MKTMKKFIKTVGFIAIAAIIGVSILGCGGDPGGGGGSDDIKVGATSGGLTINGLNSYNDQYVMAVGFTENEVLGAYENLTSTGATFGTISSSGAVTLKVWKLLSEKEAGTYNGNGEADFFVLVVSKKNFAFGESLGNYLVAAGTATVTFTNGVGSGTVENVEGGMTGDFTFELWPEDLFPAAPGLNGPGLTITGVPVPLGESLFGPDGYFSVGIFSVETAVQEAHQGSSLHGNGNGSTYTVMTPLVTYSNSIPPPPYDIPWTGDGTYRVFVTMGSYAYETTAYFSAGSATIPFASFSQLP